MLEHIRFLRLTSIALVQLLHCIMHGIMVSKCSQRKDLCMDSHPARNGRIAFPAFVFMLFNAFRICCGSTALNKHETSMRFQLANEEVVYVWFEKRVFAIFWKRRTINGKRNSNLVMFGIVLCDWALNYLLVIWVSKFCCDATKTCFVEGPPMIQ